jgi:hypothetical protein
MPFKACPSCRRLWESRDDFLASLDICLHGYQPAFENPEKGLFLFNHTIKECGTTLAVPVARFIDMYGGPHFTEVRLGLSDCSGKCLMCNDLGRCYAPCALAYIREIMQVIVKYKSNKAEKIRID